MNHAHSILDEALSRAELGGRGVTLGRDVKKGRSDPDGQAGGSPAFTVINAAELKRGDVCYGFVGGEKVFFTVRSARIERHSWPKRWRLGDKGEVIVVKMKCELLYFGVSIRVENNFDTKKKLIRFRSISDAKRMRLIMQL